MAVQYTKTISLDKDVYDAGHDYVKRMHKFTSFSRFVNHLMRVHLINAGYEIASPIVAQEGYEGIEEHVNHSKEN